MARGRILVGDPWDSKMSNSIEVIPLSTEQASADLESYCVVSMNDGVACYPEQDLQTRGIAKQSTKPAMANRPMSPAPVLKDYAGRPSADAVQIDDRNKALQDNDDDHADLAQQSKNPAKYETHVQQHAAADSPVRSTAERLLQQQLQSARSRGHELHTALEVTRVAREAVAAQKKAEGALADVQHELAGLRHAHRREVQERRTALIAAQELKYTNINLHMIISNLQADCLNQQETTERKTPAAGTLYARGTARPPTDASNIWLHDIWQATSASYPALAEAERHFGAAAYQRALCALHPLLHPGDSAAVAAADPTHPPPLLSECALLAHLLRAAVQLQARQPQLARRGSERMAAEARTLGLVAAERRAQWLRGHALLALDRPREAGACFGLCAGPRMPAARLREMRARADAAVANLPEGHPGREISEEFVQFYYEAV